MIKAIIFDMDGVISDTDRSRFEIIKGLLAKKEIKLDKSLYQDSVGERTVAFLKRHFQNRLSEDEMEGIRQERKKELHRYPKKYIEPMPYAVECIKNFYKDGYKLAVASSASIDTIRLTLETLGVKNLFSVIIGNDRITNYKPHPETYLECVKELKLKSNECVAIEDSVPGIKSAKSAGNFCIAVAYSHPKEKLIGADYIIDSLKNLNKGLISNKF